jgi:heme-degrading monooxygenase HmoA
VPIQLHVELVVGADSADGLIEAFQNAFQPTIQRQAGFRDVQLLKHRGTMVGEGSPDANFRLLIGFETEEQRQAWVASDDHQRAWPEIARHIDSAKLRAELYDVE